MARPQALMGLAGLLLAGSTCFLCSLTAEELGKKIDLGGAGNNNASNPPAPAPYKNPPKAVPTIQYLPPAPAIDGSQNPGHQENYGIPDNSQHRPSELDQVCPNADYAYYNNGVPTCGYNHTLPELDKTINPEENAGLTPEQIWAGLPPEQQKYFWDLYAIAWQQVQGQRRDDTRYTCSNPYGFYVDENGDIASLTNEIRNQVQDDEEQTQDVITWQPSAPTYF